MARRRISQAQGLANPIAMIASFGMALRYSFDMGDARRQDRCRRSPRCSPSGLRTADIKSEGTTAVEHHADGRGDPERTADAARVSASQRYQKSPGREPGILHEAGGKSIQREPRRIAAQVGRRVERLAVDRAVVVLAGERRVPVRRRESVIQELAVAGQHFGAGIEPRARGDVDAGVRALLVGTVGTVAP